MLKNGKLYIHLWFRPCGGIGVHKPKKRRESLEEMEESLTAKILRIANDDEHGRRVAEELRSTIYNITEEDVERRFNI